MVSLITRNRAAIDDAHKDETDNAMNNPNWNKQSNPGADRLTSGRPIEQAAAAKAAPEDELEAYRFRGTPIRRNVAPVVPQPIAAPQYGNGIGAHASAGS